MSKPWNCASEPVVHPGHLHPVHDAARAGAGHVMEHAGRYLMHYWGTDASGRHCILRAEAELATPTVWRPVGGPLLERQPSVVLNANGPGFPFMLPVDDMRWLLYVCCWGQQTGARLPNTTAVAVSDDGGTTFQYSGTQPLIPLDRPWDSQGTGSVWVLHDEGRFRMYYTAIGNFAAAPDGVATGHGPIPPRIGIGYAESTDGLRWHKPLDQLLIAPRGFGVDPWEYIVSKPCVLRRADGSYLMWLNTFGTAYRVHRLTSTDGLHWEWAARLGADGELGHGRPGQFDDHQRSYPSILQHGDELRCWYTGNGFGARGLGYASQRAD